MYVKVNIRGTEFNIHDDTLKRMSYFEAMTSGRFCSDFQIERCPVSFGHIIDFLVYGTFFSSSWGRDLGMRNKVLKDIVYYGVPDALDAFGGDTSLQSIRVYGEHDALNVFGRDASVQRADRKHSVDIVYKVVCLDTWMASLIGDNRRFRVSLLETLKRHFSYKKDDDMMVLDVVRYALMNDGILDIEGYLKWSIRYCFKDLITGSVGRLVLCLVFGIKY